MEWNAKKISLIAAAVTIVVGVVMAVLLDDAAWKRVNEFFKDYVLYIIGIFSVGITGGNIATIIKGAPTTTTVPTDATKASTP